MQTGMQEPSASASAPDQERLARARRRVAALKGFYIHLFAFAVVLTGLAVINAMLGRPWWVLWVLLGWGLGVLAHGLVVLASTSQAIAAWERRKLQQFMSRD
jgi:hypothetical protein